MKGQEKKKNPHLGNTFPEHHISKDSVFQTFKAMEPFLLAFFQYNALVVALGFFYRRSVGVGRGYSRSTLFITQIFVYLECLGGREQRLMEMLALLKHPMSTTRLFLNDRPQTTLQFHISLIIYKIPTPVQASRIPGVLQHTKKSTQYITCKG